MNELFHHMGTGIESYEIRIFNRWGKIVLQGVNEAWDGKNASRGMYQYQILINGVDDEIPSKLGKVVLLR